mmetsp:Transcript_1826/g.3827  ORF Transcript_1826/g.3827 Transcript_1826/m.3827 type:complete len:192 (-) Transcript_1826:29-604(-)
MSVPILLHLNSTEALPLIDSTKPTILYQNDPMMELCVHHQLLDFSSPGTIVEISTASVSHGIVGGFVGEKKWTQQNTCVGPIGRGIVKRTRWIRLFRSLQIHPFRWTIQGTSSSLLSQTIGTDHYASRRTCVRIEEAPANHIRNETDPLVFPVVQEKAWFNSSPSRSLRTMETRIRHSGPIVSSTPTSSGP